MRRRRKQPAAPAAARGRRLHGQPGAGLPHRGGRPFRLPRAPLPAGRGHRLPGGLRGPHQGPLHPDQPGPRGPVQAPRQPGHAVPLRGPGFAGRQGRPRGGREDDREAPARRPGARGPAPLPSGLGQGRGGLRHGAPRDARGRRARLDRQRVPLRAADRGLRHVLPHDERVHRRHRQPGADVRQPVDFHPHPGGRVPAHRGRGRAADAPQPAADTRPPERRAEPRGHRELPRRPHREALHGRQQLRRRDDPVRLRDGHHRDEVPLLRDHGDHGDRRLRDELGLDTQHRSKA
mmetsp:Transcript_16997/g.48389  ORF Transcript_16997/g.48389 Transcript_16997/m.48389 type:complete len:291 (-) Transcript_16997:989-1861(-)